MFSSDLRVRKCPNPLLATGLLFLLGLTGVAYPQVGPPTVELDVRVGGVPHEQPIEQARVELRRFPDGVLQVAFSDSSGRVFFPALRPGSYIVRASHPGYRTDEVAVDLRRGDTARTVKVQLSPDSERKTMPVPGTRISSRALSAPVAAVNEFYKGLELLNHKKDPQRSVPHFQKAIEAFPAYHEAYFMLGMAQLQQNALAEAQVSLAKAVELDPKNLLPYHPLAVVLFSLKRYTEEEALLMRAMELDQAGWQWPFELARCHATRGQWDKAVSYGQMAHERPNPPSKVHLLMADLYSNTGDIAKAIEELEKFARLDPNSSFMPKVHQALTQLRNRQ